MFSKILLPIDIAELDVAKEATQIAVSMAKSYNSEIRLINVVTPIVLAQPMAAMPQSIYDELGVYERAEIERIAATIDRPPERASTVVRVGGVYPEILAEAQAWGADLIVVGAHRRSMATYLLGSTAAAIVRHANCTAMVARSSKPASLL